MRQSPLLFVVILVGVLENAAPFNFLVISPVYGFSHMKYMAALANQLAWAGHNVTFFQPFVVDEYHDHDLIKEDSIEIWNYFHDEEGMRHIPPQSCMRHAWHSSMYQSDVGAAVLLSRYLFPAFEHMCRKMFEDTELHQDLKSRNYDVVLSEAFDFCGLYLADYLSMPSLISTFTGNRLNALAPCSESPLSSITFLLPRLATATKRLCGTARTTSGTSSSRRTASRNLKHWTDIIHEVTYHFSNSNPYLDFVIPTIPKVVPVGGITVDREDQKPTDGHSEQLEMLLNARKYTVFVSFGSMVRSVDMPKEYKEAMLEMFASQSNVTFLWKYESLNDQEVLQSLPRNVHIAKWFSQSALLSDRRVNVFITHGGLGSTMELAYAAKPAIVIPLFADQPGNAKMIARHQSVEVYSKLDIQNWRKLSSLLQKMLTTPSYQKHADRLAETLQFQPIPPADLMVKHAENAARFGRMPFLFMATIANQLAEEGHEVTYFQPFVIEAYQNHTLLNGDSIKVISYWHDEEGRKHMPPSNDLHDAWYSGKYQSALASVLVMPGFLFSAWEHMCRKIFQDKELHKLLRSGNFDVVIAETFDFCGLYLADYIQARSVISVFTGSRLLSITTPLGEPSSLHYLPAPSSKHFGPGASMLDRINDLYHKYVFGSGYAILFDWQFNQVSRLTEGKVKHWKEIMQDVTFTSQIRIPIWTSQCPPYQNIRVVWIYGQVDAYAEYLQRINAPSVCCQL
ncbi:unnamed protein product [Caenorhabditis sp. 36 PRJEB53466]|nr:unnamed protein product [Caenorhabditis sp. 36 PRJEB53466]